jgi:predicted phage tail protein
MTPTTIRLYGEMGRLFGRVHRVFLDSNTPAEAVRYLCSQFPRARAYLTGASSRGVGFAVFRGKENLTAEHLNEPVGGDDIRIAPMLTGSKNGGVFSIIVGAILVVAGYLGETYGQVWGGGVWGPILVNMGIAMIAGGVIQMLTPLPKGGKAQDRPENAPSYVFSGAVNTQAQGNPVPLLYGRMIVGSAVISAGINAEDYAPATSGVGPGNPHWNPKNPYEIFA